MLSRCCKPSRYVFLRVNLGVLVIDTAVMLIIALFVSWPNEDVILEVSKREKEAGIVPDPDIDTYMKVTVASPVFVHVCELICTSIACLKCCSSYVSQGEAKKFGYMKK